MSFDLRRYDSAKSAGIETAAHIAALARAAITARGTCTLALSGGKTPDGMLQALAREAVPWRHVDIFQVDERITGDRDPNRNLARLRRALRSKPTLQARIHAMPVDTQDAEDAARRYAAVLEEAAGRPPVLDIVHLGLGADGHTASLTPDDPVLEESSRDVAVSECYGGYRRLTLTVPCLTRAGALVWLVTGTEKAEAVARFVAGDPRIPACRLPRQKSTVHIDRAAAARLDAG